MIKKKFKQVLSLVMVFLMIAAVSARRDRKLLGNEWGARKTEKNAVKSDTLRVEKDGTIVVNTAPLAKDIVGYGGNVPLEISIQDGKVTSIKAQANSETPEFFGKAKSLFARWTGKTVDEAAAQEVDGVSGATYSSKAIIGNMQRGLAYVQKAKAQEDLASRFDLSAKTVCGLLVALMAAIVPLFYKNKRYRIVQQVLNVAVLGFWCGSCLSYASLISFTSNGLKPLAFPIATLLLIVAFVYPLFGKKSYYCANVCPFGSLQELAGRCVNYRIRIGATTAKRLDRLRQVLWAALMLCLWTGVWFDWVDVEPFSAFVFQSAAVASIVIAVVFLLLSTVVARPYCRFVCPMGTLFRIGS